MNAWDRERNQLERDLENGEISNTEFNRQMRAIDRDEEEAAKEAAEEAYERALIDRGFGQW